MLIYKDKKVLHKLRDGGSRKLREVKVYDGPDLVGKIEENWDHYSQRTYYSVRVWSEDYGRMDYVGDCSCVAAGKRKLKAHGYDKPQRKRPETVNMAYLPAGDASDFYPTPSALAGRMFSKVKWGNIRAVLEPSAGKGDLVDCLATIGEQWRHRRYFGISEVKKKTDVIERDANLRLILKGKGYRLIAEDFLTFTTDKRYDLIVMNPPFSNGDEHLLRAIDLMQHGGQIVCLLNAETIRNPYSNRRKVLQSQLIKYEAKIEFVRDAFKRAQRKTNVEVAIVYINIPAPRQKNSDIFERMKKAAGYSFTQDGEASALVGGNDIQQLIQLYNLEAKAGVALMEEYAALAPYIRCGMGEDAAPIIQIKIANETYGTISSGAVNHYLYNLRAKYWHNFLDRPAIQDKLTSAMAADYRSKVGDMANYDFTEHNIMQVMFDIQGQLSQGVEDSIMALFEKFSAAHSYYPECSGNIHYFTGWKTNKAHKVGKKVIIPVHGCRCDSKWSRDTLDKYDVYKLISDLERAMNFLDKGETEFRCHIETAIARANAKASPTADFTYFTAIFYKKGTCHIKFKPEAAHIIDRLNIFAARQKSWLPPTYGTKKYENLDPEEKEVIDSFQGREEYEKVCAAPGSYILDGRALVALPGAV